MTAMLLPINAADLTAAAYGRRKPRYPVITETLGLALLLLVNRSTARDRAVWLADPVVSEALCIPAEAFAQALTGQPSPDGWRGGALASLRTLAPGALGEVNDPWPWARGGEQDPVARFWLDHDEDRHRWDWAPSPAWAELRRRLAAQPRLEDAWTALVATFRYGTSRRGGSGYYAQLCGWASAHEEPCHTRWLHDELLGPDCVLRGTAGTTQAVPPRSHRGLSPANVALTDQILAALDAEGALPISTPALLDKLGLGGHHITVLRLLNRLARLREVERIELADMRCLYWRRWLVGNARAARQAESRPRRPR
jgi:hypothetical protein